MKTIIIYYSYSGNTEIAAKTIKDRLHCDIFELEPKDKYTKNYDRLVKETNIDEYRKKELKEVPDITNYDKIILMSPTWWYKMSEPIYTYITETDFKNKEVFPVITNAGWPGHAIEDMTKYLEENNAKVGTPLKLEFMPRKDFILNTETLNKWLEKM